MCREKEMISEYGRSGFKILAVSNRRLCKSPYLTQIERVCRIHPEAIILREKDLTETEYKKLATEVMHICEIYKVPCILHNFWNVAAELGCTAVHLPLAVLREIPFEEKQTFEVIGTSVHSVEEAKEAVELGATYLTAGHIYATDCKKGLPPRGLQFLQEVCDEVKVPVYGIGGVKFDEKQWDEMKKCGASGGCIMSGMMQV